MAQITWLHLSDWHQNTEKHDRKVLADKLREDLTARAEIDPRLAQVDFVVFSGDAANHGKTEEFRAVRDVLFDPVLKLLGLKPDRLFMVPGNHDLDRNIIAKRLAPALHAPLANHDAVKEWLCESGDRAHALQPFAAYEDFVRGYTGQDNPAYASIRRLDIAEKKVALLGLNTAWMCGRYKDAAGKFDDKGRVVIGEPQIEDALNDIADADLRIVVQHHAYEWLAEFDRDRAESRLKDAADIILWGHEHRPKARFEDGTDGKCLIIPGGAAFGERTASDPRYANAYNLTTLNVETGEGVVFIRTWDDESTSWLGKPKRERFPFVLPRATDKPPAAAETQERRRERAAKRYQELLLESCDIVNLAHLPEQDRHVAARKMELRRLYVPLSVVVEKEIDKLEAQRAAALGQDAPQSNEKQQRAAPGERLKQAKRLVVLGDPGAGKTTLTRWFATAFLLKLKDDPAWREMPAAETLPDAPLLPVVVRCRDLDGAVCKATLDDVLKHILRKVEFNAAEAEDTHAYLRGEIDAGRALLILDGLDEINDPTLRAGFCEQVDRIARANKDTPIIVTSRIVGYRELGVKLTAKFEHLTLAGFEPDKKDAFARNWCKLVEPPDAWEKAAADLIRDIHSSDRIERLTANPMLLTTMALVKRSVGCLPQRRVELYDEAVKVLLKWRGEYEKPLDGREALPQLQYLAYAMCDRGEQRLPKDEALKLLAELREKHPNLREVADHSPEDFLALVESRTGIMMEAGRERIDGRLTPVYEFRHLTIQEYLASRALIDRVFPGVDPTKTLAQLVAPLARRTGGSKLRYGMPEIMVVESWREPLRLLTSGCPSQEVDPVLEAVLMPSIGEPEENTRARAVQAALCLADEPAVSDPVAQKVINALVAAVREGDGSGIRNTGLDFAVDELGAGHWQGKLSTALVHKFLTVPTTERWKYGVLVGWANRLRDTAPAAVVEWLEDKIARLSGADFEAAIAALAIMRMAAEGNIPQTQTLLDQLAACLNRPAAVAHAAAWALNWVVERAEGTLSVPAPALSAYLERPDADDEAARFCMMTMAENEICLSSDLYTRYRRHDDARIRQVALGAAGADLPQDQRVLLTQYLDEMPVFLDPAKPITLARVNKAAEKLEKPEADIRARYVELAERFDLILEFDEKPSKKPRKPASPRG
jgi:predicted phosphodiesterase